MFCQSSLCCAFQTAQPLNCALAGQAAASEGKKIQTRAFLHAAVCSGVAQHRHLGSLCSIAHRQGRHCARAMSAEAVQNFGGFCAATRDCKTGGVHWPSSYWEMLGILPLKFATADLLSYFTVCLMLACKPGSWHACPKCPGGQATTSVDSKSQ